MQRDLPEITRYSESPNALTLTWIVSFEQISEANPSAAEVLNFISFIEPKAIPYSLLPSPDSEEAKEFALGTLRSYAFITSREEGETENALMKGDKMEVDDNPDEETQDEEAQDD